MHRIIDGVVFEGKPAENRLIVSVHDLGNGHREATIRPVIVWHEVGPLHPDSINAQILRGEREDPDAEDKARGRKLRSARRSKTRARRVCKVLGLDTMLTLTYAANVTDLATCKRHFELFVKRMRYHLGRFLFVAAFEQQERGAWHVHVATRRIAPTLAMQGVKVKSYDAIRAVWRAVVGDLGGTVFVSGKQARKGSRRITQRSPARIAAYVSKYLTKDFEDWPDGVRRLQTSPCRVPDPSRVEMVAASMAELVALVYAFAADGACDVVTSRVGRFGDSFYLATERFKVNRSIHSAPIA